jgi:hypothetical protein
MCASPLAQRDILLFGKARGNLRARRVAHALQIFPAPPVAPHEPMFAPHANPYARAATERVVSRRDLHASDSEGEGADADEEGVRALHTLVRRALGYGDAEACASKRRKVDAQEKNAGVVVRDHRRARRLLPLPGAGCMLSVAFSGSFSTQPSWRKRGRRVWVHRNDEHICIKLPVRTVGRSALSDHPLSSVDMSISSCARPLSCAIGTVLECRGERGSTHAGATDVLTWSVGLPGAIPRGTCRRRPARRSPPAMDRPPPAKARLAQRYSTCTAHRPTAARGRVSQCTRTRPGGDRRRVHGAWRERRADGRSVREPCTREQAVARGRDDEGLFGELRARTGEGVPLGTRRGGLQRSRTRASRRIRPRVAMRVDRRVG